MAACYVVGNAEIYSFARSRRVQVLVFRFPVYLHVFSGAFVKRCDSIVFRGLMDQRRTVRAIFVAAGQSYVRWLKEYCGLSNAKSDLR
jgi:hypothetical protein